jgi:hypothetical protein
VLGMVSSKDVRQLVKDQIQVRWARFLGKAGEGERR